MENSENKVYLVYQNVPHYREPIFRYLCALHQETVSYRLLSGNTTNLETLKIINIGDYLEANADRAIGWSPLRNYWFGEVLFQPEVLSLAFDKKCDCIVYFGSVYYLSTWISAICARMMGKRVLFWTHGYRHKEPLYKRLPRNIFYKLADGLLVYGHQAKRILAEYGFSEERIHVVYNSLNYDEQITYRNADEGECAKIRSSFKSSGPLLLWSGRMLPSRQLELLLRALVCLKDRGDRANLIIVGDGPGRKDLEALCEDLELQDCVNFYGSCHDESRLAQLFHASDLVVCPGDIGLLAIHALTYGVPVITHGNMDTHKPEVEAIIPGVSGDFFKYKDSVSLAECITNWLGMHPDKSVNRKHCFDVIDEKYNPAYQKEAIDRAVLGLLPID